MTWRLLLNSQNIVYSLRANDQPGAFDKSQQGSTKSLGQAAFSSSMTYSQTTFDAMNVRQYQNEDEDDCAFFFNEEIKD